MSEKRKLVKMYDNWFKEPNSVFDKGEDIILQIICAIWMLGVIGFLGAAILYLLLEALGII